MSAAKAGTRGGSTDINNYPSAWSLKYNDSFTTNKKDYYNSKITGGTDRFIYVFNIWPIHSDDTGDNFFYITLKNTLAFGPAYHELYKKYIFPHGTKICEWAGYQFEWSFKCAAGGINPDDIITEEHSPKTTETSTTYTNGFSFNIGGSGSVGFQGDSPTGSLGFSAGLQVSNSTTTTIPDVSYKDMTGSDDDSHVGGIFTIAEARANYATLNYGLVRVTDPALAARSTFAPDCAWVYRIKKGAAGKALFDFNAKVTLRSYKGYSNGSSGKMTTKDKTKNFPATLDLSVYKFK